MMHKNKSRPLKGRGRQAAQDIQDAIFRKMSAAEKIKLASKITVKILEIIKKKLRPYYPNLDPVSFIEEIHEHFSLNRKFYDSLSNQFLQEELKRY